MFIYYATINLYISHNSLYISNMRHRISLPITYHTYFFLPYTRRVHNVVHVISCYTKDNCVESKNDSSPMTSYVLRTNVSLARSLDVLDVSPHSISLVLLCDSDTCCTCPFFFFRRHSQRVLYFSPPLQRITLYFFYKRHWPRPANTSDINTKRTHYIEVQKVVTATGSSRVFGPVMMGLVYPVERQNSCYRVSFETFVEATETIQKIINPDMKLFLRHSDLAKLDKSTCCVFEIFLFIEAFQISAFQ